MDGRETVLGVSQVDSDESGARIQLSVKDTGIGIPKESQDRVFGEFEQADQSATRVHGGSGLGLTTSRRLEVGDEEIVDTTLAVYASEAPGIMARITNAVTSGNCDEMRAGHTASSLRQAPSGRTTSLNCSVGSRSWVEKVRSPLRQSFFRRCLQNTTP